jgi:uncharacterized membrane protein
MFYSTGDISFNPGGSFFGTHFSPILFLILPFYAIYPSVETLLVFQSAVIALGSIPLFLIARKKLGGRPALYVSLLYLMYPPLNYLTLNDFHLEALLPTFLLFMVYYIDCEDWPKFFIFEILALSTIEFAPIIVAFVGLYGFRLYLKGSFTDSRRALRFMVITILVSALWFALALEVKKIYNPYTSPIPTPFERILNPFNTIQVISYDLPLKILYVICLFAPLAFIPLLAPTSLIMAVPWIVASFATDTYSFYYSIYCHYTGFIIAPIFVALIGALSLISNSLSSHKVKRFFYLMFITTALLGFYLPMAPESPWLYSLPTPTEHTKLLYEVLSLVPSNASILTQNDIFPHVSNRLESYMYLTPRSNTSVDYILVDVNSAWYGWQSDIGGEKISPNTIVQKVLNDNTYGILASVDGILLLKKGYNAEPVMFEPISLKYDYKNIILKNGRVVEDNYSVSGSILCHRKNDTGGIFCYSPYTRLLPGLYEISFKLRTDSLKFEDPLLTIDVVASGGITKLAEKHVYGVHVPSPGQWFNVTLRFGVKTILEDVVFRCFAENQSVCIDYAVLRQLSPTPISFMELGFKAKDLYTTATAIHNGVISHLNGTGTLFYSQYLTLPKGNYTANLWFRLDKPYDGDLININVMTNLCETMVTTTTLHSSEFINVGVWQPISLTFSLTEEDKTIEFCGTIINEDAPISLLLIELRSV